MHGNLYVYVGLFKVLIIGNFLFQLPSRIIEVNRMMQKTMFQAKCTSCGKECTVPFKPAQGKPVYCRDCFAAHRSKPEITPSRGSTGFEPKQAWARRRDHGQVQKMDERNKPLQKFSHAIE
jgi:CxxC-x17-CxxC domain-containing protein